MKRRLRFALIHFRRPSAAVMRLVVISFAACFLAALPAYADPAPSAEHKRPLTLDAAFGKPYINGQLPGTIHISPDDKWIACTWADDARGYTEIWLFSPGGETRRKLTETKEKRRAELIKENEEIEDEDDRLTDDEITEKLERERNFGQLEWDPDGRGLWFVYRGDLMRIDAFPEGGAIPPMEKILHTGSWVGAIKFSEDGRYLGIGLAGEIWIRNQKTGALWQLTTDAAGTKTNDGLYWSKSGRYLAFTQSDWSNTRTTYMADFIAENVNPIPLVRPRPGDYIGTTKFGIIDLETEEKGQPKVKLIETDGQDESYSHDMAWAPDEDRLLLCKIDKSVQTWSVWELIDFAEGKAVKVFSYTDKPWFNDAYHALFWGPGRNSFVTLLERTGWSHAYYVDFGKKLEDERSKYEAEKKKKEEEKAKKNKGQLDALKNPFPGQNGESDDGKDFGAGGESEPPSGENEVETEEWFPEPVQLTFGEYEVTWLEVLDDRTTAYILTSVDGPARRSIEKLDILSGGRRRISTKQGFWSFGGAWGEGIRISDSGKTAVAYGSEAGRPASLYYVNLESAHFSLVHDPRPPEWGQWNWILPEPVEYTNTEFPGKVHAYLYLPPYHKAGDKRPVVIYIHGAGYAQDCIERLSWLDAMHIYMADTLGYAVLVVDYRGSSGYGRKWRVDVAGRLGELEDSDARAGLAYLERSGILDTEKAGIWGWSYGGFQTNMSMLRSPGVWKAGVAMAAVNDWANYNHWYSTQRLGDPKDNKEAYKKSATITYADGLAGNLLMVHGMMDDNVMVQDFMLLADELINKGKNFDMFVFPEDSHGINTTQRMIYFAKLTAGYFEDHFGRGPGAPAAAHFAD
ncbi:MAG: prolyl oligopeptidase family serine peptidase [bacterium]|jgi:dipeptidyl aminopeptidase/acylaminoacyl peptidase